MAEKPLEKVKDSRASKKRSLSKKKKASSESPHASPVLERQSSGKGVKRDEVRFCYIKSLCVDELEVARSTSVYVLNQSPMSRAYR